ncbi:MAG: hypothetical protein J7M26_04020 [Armatimonadetes bacterium]|nr:hypothetical protein [Armatimonadota bacterium]
MRKRGMGRDPLSWIGEGTKQESRGAAPTEEKVGEREEVERPAEAPPMLESATREVPKFATLVPVTARLSESQVEFLETMERRIMRNRRRRRERITKNTIIRAALELLMALDWDHTDIADEEELVQRIKAAAGLA